LFDDISIFSDIASVKTIVLHPAAAKALDKMPVATREQISQALHNYAITGRGDTRAITGTPTVRLRAGDNCVIFDETKIEIVVLAIGNRREIYR
jgi:mRNA interferase RelE/StbE